MEAFRLKPSLHEDFEIDQPVMVDIGNQVHVTGTVVGVAWQHIISVYIVLLDEPLLVPGWERPWKAITIPGGMLTKLAKY